MNDPNHQPSRRGILIGAGLGALALGGMNAYGQESQVQLAAPASPKERKRAIRLAHMTDMHIQPERKADQGVAACLKHLQAQKDKPELILCGGDTVMDSFDADESRTRTQWDIWKRVWKDEAGVPANFAIGNHDIWGWNKKKSKTTGSEAMYGKKWVLDVFGRDKPWTSFDKAGWHFIILDSTQHENDGYVAYLDDEQYAWLENDLKATKPDTPTLILTHIPILSIAALAGGEGNTKDKKWQFGGGLLHLDAVKLKKLFYKHPNVKLCLSGHLHLVDRCEYLGVNYLCNGAVSGGWWRGAHQECEPGYALLDLYDDGTFENRYVTYGWKAAEA